jgi:hypothetical protein
MVTLSAPATGFCQRIAVALPLSSCLENEKGASIEMAESFGSGKYLEARMVPSLRALGRAIETYVPPESRVWVAGSASAASLSCGQLRAARPAENPCAWTGEEAAKVSCSDDPQKVTASAGSMLEPNRLLARDRACWAAGVMAGSSPAVKKLIGVADGQPSPQPGDHAFDRKISVRVEWKR